MKRSYLLNRSIDMHTTAQFLIIGLLLSLSGLLSAQEDFSFSFADDAMVVDVSAQGEFFVVIKDAHRAKESVVMEIALLGPGKATKRVPFKMLRDFGRVDGWLVSICCFKRNERDEYVKVLDALKKVPYGVTEK